MPHLDRETWATVRHLDGESVTIELAVDGACGSCASRTACSGTRLLRLPLAACEDPAAGRLPTMGARVRVFSDLPAIRAGLLAYLLPVLLLLAGAAVGQWLFERLAGIAAPPLLADLGAAAGGLLGLLAGLLALRRLGRGFRLRLVPPDSDDCAQASESAAERFGRLPSRPLSQRTSALSQMRM